MRYRALMAAVLAVAGAGAVAACGSSGGSGGSAKQITVWSEENDASRVQATQRIIAGFTRKTGIKVKLVGIDSSQFDQLVTSAAAGGKMPDVMGALPLDAVQYLAANDLVDTGAVGKSIQTLGSGTLDPTALRLTRYKGKPAAVPSDSFAQLLIYRKDLFKKAGLPVPNTFDNIAKAAAALNKKGMAGIAASTVANDAFTEQTFEDFALANGCQLVDAGGQATLNSKPCVDTFTFYTNLIKQYSVPGTQDVDTTRATYFSGKSAMVVWSSYILDEMAGLRNDALPTCPECKKDPAFLAKNSGFVTSMQGPDGTKPEQFGEINSWTIGKGANASAAQQFVDYMMDTGYTDWLGFAPEGKFPVRKGTAAEPDKFVTAWEKLKAGVDKKAPLSDLYAPDVITALKNTMSTLNRWALPQGQGKLLGATQGQFVVPKAVNAATSGQRSPQQAAQQAQQAVQQIQKTLR
jgi:multiple sugar transport system substrate-binding protein